MANMGLQQSTVINTPERHGFRDSNSTTFFETIARKRGELPMTSPGCLGAKGQAIAHRYFTDT